MDGYEGILDWLVYTIHGGIFDWLLVYTIHGSILDWGGAGLILHFVSHIQCISETNQGIRTTTVATEICVNTSSKCIRLGRGWLRTGRDQIYLIKSNIDF